MKKEKMNIAIKFGYDNQENNYYDFYDVKDIKVVNEFGEKYLTFTYFGKRLGTRNKAMFPQQNTWIVIKGDK